MNYRGISIIVIFVFCWVLVVPVLADEGFWRSRSIDAERDDLGSYCSLKIDGNDQVYIAYYSVTDECLKLAWEPYSGVSGAGRPFFAWSRLTPGRGMGRGVSLWVNDTGMRFAFSCINQTNHVFLGEGAFRAAGRDGLAPYIVSMEDVTQYYSVAGVPTSISRYKDNCGINTYIGYPDANVQHSGLELVEKFQKTNYNQNCVVDDYTHWHLFRGYNGYGHAVAYDSTGEFALCWYDPENRTLLYNSYEVVDGGPGHPAGRYCSLAFDSHGNPHISYQDVSGLCALKYAFNNGTGWYNYTIDSSVNAGQFTSIAIDANDEPHISYSTGSQLKYASLNGTTWYTQVVDNTPTVWTSIDVDSKNKPHIAYYDLRKHDLRFAWWEPNLRAHPFPR